MTTTTHSHPLSSLLPCLPASLPPSTSTVKISKPNRQLQATLPIKRGGYETLWQQQQQQQQNDKGSRYQVFFFPCF